MSESPKSSHEALPIRYRTATLDTWATADDERKTGVLASVRRYVDDWPQRLADGCNLLFCGQPGTGKTHLAVAVARAVIDQGGTAKYVNLTEASAALQASLIRTYPKTYKEVLGDFAQADLLVIDDVGRQIDAQYSDAEALFVIINARYSAYRPTLVITNLDPKSLAEYVGDAVMDRLRQGGGRVVAFDWVIRRGH